MFKSLANLFTFIAICACLSACSQQATEESKAETPSAPSMPLNEAALRGDLAAIQAHIAAGTDIDAKDEFGSTPLIVASTFGQTEAARTLLDAGANVDLKSNDGSTPLHVAAFLCYPEIVQALLEKGADKEAKNNNGATALQSVTAPFEMVKPVYDILDRTLGPLGLELDYDRIKATRPQIAAMLQQ